MDKVLYYVDYDEVDQMWCVMEADAGSEHKQLFDVCVCQCQLKQEALLIRDALESFPCSVTEYIENSVGEAK